MTAKLDLHVFHVKFDQNELINVKWNSKQLRSTTKDDLEEYIMDQPNIYLPNIAAHSIYQKYPHMIVRDHQLQEHYTYSRKLVSLTLEVHLRNSSYILYH